MNYKILIGLMLVGMLLLTGCNSSLRDCSNDCKSLYRSDFKYDGMCLKELTTGNKVPCEKTNYTALKEFCFKECNNQGGIIDENT